jgi:hypothetical protein
MHLCCMYLYRRCLVGLRSHQATALQLHRHLTLIHEHPQLFTTLHNCSQPLATRVSTMATFRDAGISGDFVHERLSDPKTMIRLIQIDRSSADPGNEIRCTISTHPLNDSPCPSKHPLNDSPPYVAISYTWGDTSRKRRIWVNEKRVNVGYNSWLALWQAIRLDRQNPSEQPLMVWMDVLSIDQTHDVEKGIQVGLMGKIYYAAKYVLASVGDHENDSEYLVEQVHATAEYIDEKRRLEGEKEDPPTVPFQRPNCCVCERQLGTLLTASKCALCRDNSLFCFACAHDHEANSHEAAHTTREHAVVDPDHCGQCNRPVPFRWYESPHQQDERSLKLCFFHHLLVAQKLCRACELLDRRVPRLYTEWILKDVWGTVGTEVSGRLKRSPGTFFSCSRLLEMSNESQQRIADAFSAFSFRPYFTRLWVRTSTSEPWVESSFQPPFS